MDVDRRRFVEMAAGIVAAASLEGCASVALARVTPIDGTVRLPLITWPRLGEPGGYLRILPDGLPDPIYVLALGDGGFAAVSPICTHRGCTVNVEGRLLVCPCHGSTYDREGTVLRGPAEDRLRRYPVSVVRGEVVVAL